MLAIWSAASNDKLSLWKISLLLFFCPCRKINVTGFSYKSKCHNTVAPQKYFIIFCELRGNELVAKFDDVFGASAEWSERNERRIWHGVGEWKTNQSFFVPDCDLVRKLFPHPCARDALKKPMKNSILFQKIGLHFFFVECVSAFSTSPSRVLK